MSQTFSTVNRDMAAGRVYSTQPSVRSAPPARRPIVLPGSAPTRTPMPASVPALTAATVAPAPAVPPSRRFSFRLGPMAPLQVKAAFPEVVGMVALEGREGEAHQVAGQLSGLPPVPDPAIQPALWLIHDLTVPTDLAPADLAALPKGSTGTGNQPGAVFTMDGNPPTYGPEFNTLSVTVSPGRFSRTDGSNWRLQTTLDPTTNRGFHPLYFAGPEALADMNAAVPSGTLARILTDIFVRPATVHPELPVSSQYLPRLKVVTARHLGMESPVSALDPSGFTRAAVTLEGLVRPTPTLMPTRENCILLGDSREES